MGTRCNIHFNHGNHTQANIYKHWDGYPGDAEDTGVLKDLHEFFTLLKAEVTDNRFGDAEYLAAKFIVWHSQRDAEGSHYLEFLGIGPCLEDHGDIEYIYDVDCDKRDEDGFPVVQWKRA